MNGLNKEPRLRFTDEERADPALEKPIRKVDKAAAKADKAQAKIPKKQVRQKTVDPETGSYQNFEMVCHYIRIENPWYCSYSSSSSSTAYSTVRSILPPRSRIRRISCLL